jgi:hypothetical protein
LTLTYRKIVRDTFPSGMADYYDPGPEYSPTYNYNHTINDTFSNGTQAFGPDDDQLAFFRTIVVSILLGLIILTTIIGK